MNDGGLQDCIDWSAPLIRVERKRLNGGGQFCRVEARMLDGTVLFHGDGSGATEQEAANWAWMNAVSAAGGLLARGRP